MNALEHRAMMDRFAALERRVADLEAVQDDDLNATLVNIPPDEMPVLTAPDRMAAARAAKAAKKANGKDANA